MVYGSHVDRRDSSLKGWEVYVKGTGPKGSKWAMRSTPGQHVADVIVNNRDVGDLAAVARGAIPISLDPDIDILCSLETGQGSIRFAGNRLIRPEDIVPNNKEDVFWNFDWILLLREAEDLLMWTDHIWWNILSVPPWKRVNQIHAKDLKHLTKSEKIEKLIEMGYEDSL